MDDASDPESNSSHEPVHESLEHEDAGDADDTWWLWWRLKGPADNGEIGDGAGAR